MKRPETKKRPETAYDYEQARLDAVSWLGERYLLATPQPKREEPRPQYFVQPRDWFHAVRRPVTRH